MWWIRKSAKKQNDCNTCNIECGNSEKLKFLANNARRVYEAELKREQSLLDQTNRLLIFLSLFTAALSTVLPKILEAISSASTNPSFKGTAYIITALLALLVSAALVFTLLAQWRYRYATYPDLTEIENFVLQLDASYSAEEIEDSYDKEYFTELYNSLKGIDDKRCKRLQTAMCCSLCICSVIIICIVVFLFKSTCVGCLNV